MSYFRSYFEKNNTILKNSYVNTAKNPTTEIFYGSTNSNVAIGNNSGTPYQRINTYGGQC